jgi:hypothetical protein
MCCSFMQSRLSTIDPKGWSRYCQGDETRDCIKDKRTGKSAARFTHARQVA